VDQAPQQKPELDALAAAYVYLQWIGTGGCLQALLLALQLGSCRAGPSRQTLLLSCGVGGLL